MKDEVVNVGVAEYFVTHNPHVLASFGLGSCVGIALYDERKKIGGLAHIMLPDSKAITKRGGAGRYADTAIEAMVEEMERFSRFGALEPRGLDNVVVSMPRYSIGMFSEGGIYLSLIHI